MSMTVDGVWKVGVWATTVWADGVWYEGAYIPPPPPVNTTPPGGGRVIGWTPEAPAKRIVKVQWTDDNEKELIKRLKAIDDDFEEKRKAQYRELLEILRSAIHLGNQISFSGFNYLNLQDIQKAKRKVQIEEENSIILALISDGSI